MDKRVLMRAPRLDLLIIVYGSSTSNPLDDSRFGPDQRRVEIKLAPRIPADVANKIDEINAWTNTLVQGFLTEVKHSQKWHCEFCDKLARESHAVVLSWAHLRPSRFVAYIHLVCDARPETVCGRKLVDIVAFTGATSPVPQIAVGPQLTGPMYFPAAASCAGCKSEETIPLVMSRCSKCKLIRYCSVECQRQDWGRHKGNCNAVQQLTWVWN